MIITEVQCHDLHKLYNKISAMDIPWSMGRQYQWEQFLVHKGTRDDLELVLKWKKKQVREGELKENSLLLRNLIQDMDKFQEDLALARKEKDPEVKPEIKNKWLEKDPNKVARSAADILRESEALKKLQEFKKNL